MLDQRCIIVMTGPEMHQCEDYCLMLFLTDDEHGGREGGRTERAERERGRKGKPIHLSSSKGR